MAAKGIETRVFTGDADTYIVRCGLEKATSHPIIAITGQDVDQVVLLIIALAPPESNICFMEPGMGKVEDKLFSTRKFQKNFLFPKPSSFSMHLFMEKAKHYSYIVQKSTELEGKHC
ncbi:hypothetical protein AVEN_81993-1 [Araneus ventricosus]|uniref:Uncharacterized protein n=1 Tax=Araneus ventricosus TaxID=182803 RepID=A0A4Y2J235_ARAVE|nr:hypothetical protein AVEN_81993-1 [Araneus ventricosus]